jgi:hypothetical protein
MRKYPAFGAVITNWRPPVNSAPEWAFGARAWVLG